MISKLPPCLKPVNAALGAPDAVFPMYFLEVQPELVVSESGRRERGGAKGAVVAVVPPERTGGVSNRAGARCNVSDNVVTCDVGGVKMFPTAMWTRRGRGCNDTLLEVPFDVCQVDASDALTTSVVKFFLTRVTISMRDAHVLLEGGRRPNVAVAAHSAARQHLIK